MIDVKFTNYAQDMSECQITVGDQVINKGLVDKDEKRDIVFKALCNIIAYAGQDQIKEVLDVYNINVDDLK